MKKFILTISILFTGLLTTCSFAQEKNKLQLTTGVGINIIQGRPGQTFRSSVAFNSGFEKQFDEHWFGQAELNFNTLKYDQQIKDDNSPYLFQNTNSSLFMVGVNTGRDFRIHNSRWFVSAYGGTGLINIGEPRLKIDEINAIVTQEVIRKSGILGKAGSRLGFETGSKFFQTLYLDGSYWISSVKTQSGTLNSLAIFVGMRMSMTN